MVAARSQCPIWLTLDWLDSAGSDLGHHGLSAPTGNQATYILPLTDP